MTDTINGRTPEEIKKGLAHCATEGSSCKGCAFCADCDVDIYAIERYAIAYIQQLEDGIKLLRAYNKGTLQKIVQLERERNAAVKAVGKLADNCDRSIACEYCEFRDYQCITCEFKWRGVQEVE